LVTSERVVLFILFKANLIVFLLELFVVWVLRAIILAVARIGIHRRVVSVALLAESTCMLVSMTLLFAALFGFFRLCVLHPDQIVIDLLNLRLIQFHLHAVVELVHLFLLVVIHEVLLLGDSLPACLPQLALLLVRLVFVLIWCAVFPLLLLGLVLPTPLTPFACLFGRALLLLKIVVWLRIE
jgi:hypothetical protein